MKKITLIVSLALLFLTIEMHAAEPGLNGDFAVYEANKALNERLKGVGDKKEATKLLQAVVSDKQKSLSERLAAIEMLADARDKESIALLVENISLRPYPSVGTKAVNSLAKIGEPAMSQVFTALNEAVLSGGSLERQEDLVLAIAKIKGNEKAIEKWFYENQTSMNPQVRDAFCRYATQW